MLGHLKALYPVIDLKNTFSRRSCRVIGLRPKQWSVWALPTLPTRPRGASLGREEEEGENSRPQNARLYLGPLAILCDCREREILGILGYWVYWKSLPWCPRVALSQARFPVSRGVGYRSHTWARVSGDRGHGTSPLVQLLTHRLAQRKHPIPPIPAEFCQCMASVS